MARKNFADVIRRRLEMLPGLADEVEDARFSMKISHAVYAARTEAGLTQGELAARAGTHQSAIARLEDADYEGHSLTMLKRIGDALNKELHVEFRDKEATQGRLATSTSSAAMSIDVDLGGREWRPRIHNLKVVA